MQTQRKGVPAKKGKGTQATRPDKKGETKGPARTECKYTRAEKADSPASSEMRKHQWGMDKNQPLQHKEKAIAGDKEVANANIGAFCKVQLWKPGQPFPKLPDLSGLLCPINIIKHKQEPKFDKQVPRQRQTQAQKRDNEAAEGTPKEFGNKGNKGDLPIRPPKANHPKKWQELPPEKKVFAQTPIEIKEHGHMQNKSGVSTDQRNKKPTEKDHSTQKTTTVETKQAEKTEIRPQEGKTDNRDAKASKERTVNVGTEAYQSTEKKILEITEKAKLLLKMPRELSNRIAESPNFPDMPVGLFKFSFQDIYDKNTHPSIRKIMQKEPDLIKRLIRNDLHRISYMEGVPTRKVRCFFHHKYGLVGEQLRKMIEYESLFVALKTIREERGEGEKSNTSAQPKKDTEVQSAHGVPKETDKAKKIAPSPDARKTLPKRTPVKVEVISSEDEETSDKNGPTCSKNTEEEQTETQKAAQIEEQKQQRQPEPNTTKNRTEKASTEGSSTDQREVRGMKQGTEQIKLYQEGEKTGSKKSQKGIDPIELTTEQLKRMVETPAGKKRVIDALLQDRSPINNWELINNIATYRTVAIEQRDKRQREDHETHDIEAEQTQETQPIGKIQEDRKKIPPPKKYTIYAQANNMTVKERDTMKNKMNEWGSSHSSEFTNPTTAWIYRCPIQQCKMRINPRGFKRNMLSHINSKHKDLEHLVEIEVFNKDRNKTHSIYAPMHRTMVAKLPLSSSKSRELESTQQEADETDNDIRVSGIEYDEEGEIRRQQSFRTNQQQNSQQDEDRDNLQESTPQDTTNKSDVAIANAASMQEKSKEKKGPVARGEHLPDDTAPRKGDQPAEQQGPEMMDAVGFNDDPTPDESSHDFLLTANNSNKRRRPQDEKWTRVRRGRRGRSEEDEEEDEEEQERQMREGKVV